jgi:hypothetical protein
MVEELHEAHRRNLKWMNKLKHKTHRDTNDEQHQRKQYTYLLAIVVRISRLVRLQDNKNYFTGPSLSIVVFVSASRGVDAKIHTPPACSWMAVDLPPSGIPRRVKGLHIKLKGEIW